MFSYDGLKTQIDQARLKTANFHLVDLHVHTINSYDYPTTHDKPGFVKTVPESEKELGSDPDLFCQNLVLHAKQKGIRLLAITDHNESDIAEKLSKLSDSALVILPGIEISVQTNLFNDSDIHILAIFPIGTTSKQIDKVFPPSCNIPSSGHRAGARTNQPLKEILKNIRDMHGISVAAHVNSSNGVRTMVLSQNIDWLQKNYLRRFLKERQNQNKITIEENQVLEKLNSQLKPLDDSTQNTYLKFLAEHDFSAIQIQDWTHLQYYEGDHVDSLNLSPFACILSSDAHTIADLGCENHRTYVKMTEIGLSGLQKAFRDPGTRIRYDRTLPTSNLRHFLGMSFEGGSFDGQTIGFSNNLTVLIGSRGTGKSALIESLRYLLCQSTNTLPDHLHKAIIDRLDFTLRETDIKLLFSDEQGELIVIKRRYGDSKTNCFSFNGQPLPEIEFPSSARVRAEIYGWSEIEELSDSSRKQLSLLDRTVINIETLISDVKQKLELLHKNNDAIISFTREIQNLLLKTQGSEEMRRQLEKLDKPELNEAFKSFDINSAGQLSLNHIKQKIDEIELWLLNQEENRDLDKILTDTLDNEKSGIENYDWFNMFSEAYGKSKLQIKENYDQLLQEVSSLKKSIQDHVVQLEQEQIAIEAQLNSLAEQSGQSDFKAALSKRKDYSDKLAKIEAVEKEISEKQTSINKLFENRKKNILPGLKKARLAVYQARMAKIQVISNKLSQLKAGRGISISIDHLGDRVIFAKELGNQEKSKYSGLFKGIDKYYLSKNYPGYYSAKFLPHDFIDIFLNNFPNDPQLKIRYIRHIRTGEISKLVNENIELIGADLVEKDSKGNEISRWSENEYEFIEIVDIEKIWNHLSPLYYEDNINKFYDPEKLRSLLELDILEIEDYPRILLDGRPIEELSPGQRCSALIPIILVEGQNPIVIDQPEDNLDNKHVFDLVVDIIRGLKEQRQIILATHNPNIPVSGDAEQIVVFESPSKNVCNVVEQGSIDDDQIVKHIKTIMEGGDKAFEIRVKKYNLINSS